MCMVTDEDYWEFSVQKWRRAAKAHFCGECGRVIAKGEPYMYFSGLYDGHFSQHKQCAHCTYACRWLEIICNGWIYGAVKEDLVEHWVDSRELRSPGLAELIVGIGTMWSRGEEPIPVFADQCARETAERCNIKLWNQRVA